MANSMKLGIFNKVFERHTIEANLDAVVANELASIQLNLETLGGESMPADLPEALCTQVRSALAERGIELAAVSGTWNVLHPTEGPAGLARLRVLAHACGSLGTELITMCTGTRDADYLWRAHPDNDSPEAWSDAVRAMAAATQIAAEADVTLVFEPEVNNVVNTASKARRLLDEVASPHLQVVIDGANLFQAGQLARMRQVLDEAFQLLGDDIRMAHAKDLEKDGDAGHQAAGTGVLDYEYYLACLDRVGFNGSVILHSLEEERVPASRDFVRQHLP
ncbi:MAG TPA: sugar phosphate isomerase/epimerase [Candidatus Latescibacteria bacterium]|nr:sugar phosphate isomerase/epimerase [Candidatus Latescibacterota bacterium]